ncbi:MAG TPA: hydantoinase/oxoprolinase family protein [Gemmatimonadaceae bacterium]|nr:hydantoinase/oxoprolinase family protein [Gemmatimonadaceae bacterium]
MSLWVGVDVGGTFTDLVAIDGAGNVETRKVLSTPADQSDGVMGSLRELGRPNVARFVHGTTVATNMLLERNGARVAFCVTEGFTDLLYLRRQNRASLYDLSADWPAPLAPAEMTVAVPERIEPQGVTRALTAHAAVQVAERVAALEPAIVAVLLLHSYRDPTHERMLRDALRTRMPQVDVVLSSDVFPEIREYERAATTVAEAYLRPGVSRYLRNLQFRLTARPTDRPESLGVMTSSGGMRTIDEAQSGAAQLALSGPAGGVVGAAAIARALKIPRALTIDIGGTSADVGLILDGEALVEPGGSVADVPISMPRVLVETVSAGGGSIAWVDDGGALRVGPKSAGARPGPVAFGRGGIEPTVTDANVALGRITGTRMSGGVSLDVAAARASVARLANALRDSEARTARAIVATADATMARALRRVSVERGVDPRDCVLIAFGGGGPLHGCGLADMLGIGRIVVPPHAGVLSALGLAMTPERRESMTSVMQPLDRWADSARQEAGAALTADMPAHLKRRSIVLRMRYTGQGHELDVPMPAKSARAALARSFAALHEARYGFTLAAPIEVVSMRAVAEGAGRDARLGSGRPSSKRTRGPVSVELPDATLWIAKGWTGRALSGGGWLLERS